MVVGSLLYAPLPTWCRCPPRPIGCFGEILDLRQGRMGHLYRGIRKRVKGGFPISGRVALLTCGPKAPGLVRLLLGERLLCLRTNPKISS
jgi:hypothetical protein